VVDGVVEGVGVGGGHKDMIRGGGGGGQQVSVAGATLAS
jgi:hypothetical protein